MARRDALLWQAVVACGGLVVKTTGDGLYAACLQGELCLGTRNENDFVHTGITVINPWEIEALPSRQMCEQVVVVGHRSANPVDVRVFWKRKGQDIEQFG